MEQGRPAFAMRVGIHTGPIVAGIVGVGFALALVYERTRSIAACMATHAIFNLVQLQVTFVLYT